MGGRSLSPEENARVVEAVRELLRRGETQTSIAAALKGKQSTISSLIAGNHRAGYGFARSLAALLGIPLDELLRGRPVAVGLKRWRDLPQWPAVIAQARALFPRADADAWAWLESLGGAEPPLDPVTLGTIAMAWMNRPLPKAAEPETPPVQSRRRAASSPGEPPPKATGTRG
jgi:transcriptional regulator with XRE-family HTH domain